MGRRHSVPGPAERASEAVALEGSQFLGGSMSVPAPKKGIWAPCERGGDSEPLRTPLSLLDLCLLGPPDSARGTRRGPGPVVVAEGW